MQAIMQAQLKSLSQVGAWGDVGKPWQDMAFLFDKPSIAVGYEKVFGQVAVWVHLHQAYYHTLEEVAHKLALLVDESKDWAYAFFWLNKTLSHVPLWSEGHVSTMMDGTPSTDAQSWLQ